MQDLKLSVDDYSKILLMEMNDWQAVGVECSRVLETVLRENLRENQIERARTNLQNIIKFNFKLEQTQITTAIVSDLIVPTSPPFSPEETQRARALAMANVQPSPVRLLRAKPSSDVAKFSLKPIWKPWTSLG